MRQIREEHTDHLNRKHYQFYEATKDADVEQIMENRVPQIEQNLMDAETEKVIQIIESGKQMPKLEFTNVTDIKTAFMTRQTEYETEIIDLTTKKIALESEVK